MSKLFYSTQTCSTASRIVLEESGLNITEVEVSWERKLNVETLDKLNPLGAVPTLETDQGDVLTQSTAILEYLADLAPEKGLLAPAGSVERALIMSWVAFASSDLQKSFAPSFLAEKMTLSEDAQKEIEKYGETLVRGLLSHVDQAIHDKTFIVGNRFTIADAALFVFTGWAEWIEIDLSEYKNLSRYRAKIAERPAVQKTLRLEDS